MAGSLGSLVVELAANTARLSGDLGRGVNMLQGFVGKAKSVVGLLGIGVGGGLFAGLARQAIELGDELQKGAQRAGIAASTFSELAAAAKQTDIDIGTLSRGLRALQNAISDASSGNKKAADAFFELGLNLDQLRNLSADKQLKAIADALKSIPNQTDRVRLGQDALNKAYIELVPLLDEGAEGITKLVEAQKALGNTFSNEQIKALADADDAIKELKASWSGFATTLTAEVAPALSSTLQFLTRMSSNQKLTAEQIRERLKDLSPESVTGRELVAQLPEAEHRERLAALDRRPTFSRSAIGPKALADARRQYLAEEEDRKKALEQAKKDAKELERIREAHLDDKVTDAGGILAVDPAQLERTRADYAGFFSAIEEDSETTLEKIVHDSRDAFDRMSEFGKQAARNMQDAFANFLFDPFKNGLKGLLRGFIDVIRRMAAEAAAARIFEYLTGKGGSGKGSNILTTILGAIFGGKRAAGGPVSAGRAYLVGEKGPELFLPNHSGAIAANAGGMTFAPIYNIDARGATTDLINALPAVLRANNEALKQDIMDTMSRRPPPRR